MTFSSSNLLLAEKSTNETLEKPSDTLPGTGNDRLTFSHSLTKGSETLRSPSSTIDMPRIKHLDNRMNWAIPKNSGNRDRNFKLRVSITTGVSRPSLTPSAPYTTVPSHPTLRLIYWESLPLTRPLKGSSLSIRPVHAADGPHPCCCGCGSIGDSIALARRASAAEWFKGPQISEI